MQKQLGEHWTQPKEEPRTTTNQNYCMDFYLDIFISSAVYYAIFCCRWQCFQSNFCFFYLKQMITIENRFKIARTKHKIVQSTQLRKWMFATYRRRMAKENKRKKISAWENALASSLLSIALIHFDSLNRKWN